ncbi:exodeoxyribonuclease VII large subunit [Sulfurimonas sp.]|uniref:exodeoxyribonuclease VII large subunit n=1 Tax=Sulfurimonas sp. TaxID=2022749 RepID=UPI003569C574
MNVLNVSSLNEQIKTLLESSFSRVLVEGELSRITFHNSGHIYFTLKDSTSTLKAVMFKGNATKLKFQLKEGLKVILDGAITLYKPRGEYQINCFSIEPAGHGALALAYEQLKQKLASQGYFEPSRKKQLPKFPSKIALITSASGAALQDMLRVANTRYRALEIDIYDVLVQGESAASSIANAIIVSDTRDYDFIVIGRGGGSIEDLWAFNEEIVADAIFRAKTPIVSAVGHEIDWVISDFVSDLRAPTPSAAMQMTLPDTNELYQTLDSLSSQHTQLISQKLQSSKQELSHLYSLYSTHSIEKKLEQKMQEVKALKESFSHAITTRLNVAQNQVLNLQKMLESNHPKFKSKKGFAQISQNSKVIDISTLNVGDEFTAQSDEVSISAKVIKRENII